MIEFLNGASEAMYMFSVILFAASLGSIGIFVTNCWDTTEMTDDLGLDETQVRFLKWRFSRFRDQALTMPIFLVLFILFTIPPLFSEFVVTERENIKLNSQLDRIRMEVLDMGYPDVPFDELPEEVQKGVLKIISE